MRILSKVFLFALVVGGTAITADPEQKYGTRSAVALIVVPQHTEVHWHDMTLGEAGIAAGYSWQAAVISQGTHHVNAAVGQLDLANPLARKISADMHKDGLTTNKSIIRNLLSSSNRKRVVSKLGNTRVFEAAPAITLSPDHTTLRYTVRFTKGSHFGRRNDVARDYELCVVYESEPVPDNGSLYMTADTWANNDGRLVVDTVSEAIPIVMNLYSEYAGQKFDLDKSETINYVRRGILIERAGRLLAEADGRRVIVNYDECIASQPTAQLEELKAKAGDSIQIEATERSTL